MTSRGEIFHVGLTVANLERSLGFYRDVMGMEVLSVVELDSEGFGRLTRNPEARLRTALLRTGALQLQLVQYTSGGGAPLAVDHRNPGAAHLSFWVENVDSLHEDLSRTAEVAIMSEPVEVVPGLRSFYVADPDGVPVELIQRARG